MVFASLLLLLAAADAPPPAAAGSAPDPNQKICKKFPPPVGTRLGDRRICKTRWEWEQEKIDNKSVLDDVQRNPGRPFG